MEPYPSCRSKQEKLLQLFAPCTTAKERYLKIMDLGKNLEPFPESDKQESHRVSGCQSKMYLSTRVDEKGRVHFRCHSDALISAGLAALLIAVYSGELPETIIKCPPDFLLKLDMENMLTPGRSNGLHSLHLRMKQEALKVLLATASRDGSPE